MSIVQPKPDGKSPARKAISKRIRYEVLRRDNHTCRYCHATDTPLTIDHVVPVALGGSDDPSNLVAACKDCNAGKTSSAPDAATVAQVSTDAERWARAMRQAAAELAAAQEESEGFATSFGVRWDELNHEYRLARVAAPSTWADQVEHWRVLGASVDSLTDAAAIAMRNPEVENYDVWRYMCGVIWNRIRKMQDRAAEIVGAV